MWNIQRVLLFTIIPLFALSLTRFLSQTFPHSLSLSLSLSRFPLIHFTNPHFLNRNPNALASSLQSSPHTLSLSNTHPYSLSVKLTLTLYNTCVHSLSISVLSLLSLSLSFSFLVPFSHSHTGSFSIPFRSVPQTPSWIEIELDSKTFLIGQ